MQISLAFSGWVKVIGVFSLLVIGPTHQAFGQTAGLTKQSTEQPRGAGNGTVDEKDVHALEPGKPLKRELSGEQQHIYQIKLSADQFLKVIVEQDGIDVVVQASGPDGKKITEFDSESRKQGQESVLLVAEVAGDHRLTVQPKKTGAPAGRYEIRVEELRAATENDRALYEARKLYDENIKLQRAGKYDEALPLVERALEIRERILGTDHRDVAAAINSLGVLHRSKGDFAKAEPLYQRALAIREKAVGSEHPDVAASLNNLALLYWDIGDYSKAEPLYHRALGISERALGPDHLNIAFSLNNLGVFYWTKGDYEKAEPLYHRALTIWEKELGPEHPHVAATLDNLANLYRDKGDYVKAEPPRRRALTIRQKVFGPDHPDVALSLNNLAILYRDRGDNEKAEPLYQSALTVREKALGPEHPDVAQSLNNYAELYRVRGDYEKAESMHQRALTILEKALGPEHPEVANSLHNIANIYRQRGDDEKAEPLYHRALAIREKVLGQEHPSVANSLESLAELSRSRGVYAKAESLHQRALAIREKILGLEHSDVANSLNELAMLAAAKGDIAQSVKFQARANTISEHNLALNLATNSERQKLAYLAILSKQADQTISLHLRNAPNDSAARSLATTVILERKGRALDATSESLNALRSRFNAEDRDVLDRLTDTRSQIAKLILDGPQRMTGEQYRERIKALEDQAERYEADISRRSDEFRAQSLPITLAAVQAAIPADAALIEFASYRPFDVKAAKDDEAFGQPHYVAYVVRHQGESQSIELGEAKAVDKAIAALRKALRDPKRKDVKKLARAVDERVFQPVRPLIGELTRLLISPEGTLNLIPFAALVDERGRYLVERYSISYLTSGRDLLRLQVKRESQNGPLVVANPDFGGPRQIAMMRRLKQKAGALKVQPKQQIDEVSPASVFGQIYFPPLPYTAEEGEALRALLPGATLLTKREASKPALVQVRSPSLLHIATHGFFLEDLKLSSTGERGAEALGRNQGRRLKPADRSGARIENPLLRSGLALAGANEHKKDDNGILTALEVTGLNLWGTKLVVLSACDTGVGEVKTGDGVHGLRRALVLAGAETQVMSLWPVSDRWTRELMVAYYGGLQRGRGRGEALRQVQLEMLKDVKRQHPYYWASFIQSGEWGNLEKKRGR